MEENKELELRMYFFVPYNIAPIQHGIQAGHSMGEYLLKYGRYNPDHPVWDFLEKHKTWIILNGGTTNVRMIEVGDERMFAGGLNNIYDQLIANDIECTHFIEPDLNDALSAVCFVCDERVFNFDEYPNLKYFILNYKYEPNSIKELKQSQALNMSDDELKLNYIEEYNEWIEFVGGEKNVFLKELIYRKPLA